MDACIFLLHSSSIDPGHWYFNMLTCSGPSRLKTVSFCSLLFSNPHAAPRDPPTKVTAMATSPVSILIQWGHVPCINRNSNITGYIVRYSRGGGSAVNVSVSGTGQSERTYTATCLSTSTNYSIQVAAVTSTGVTGPFSTTVTETTSPPRSEYVRYSWLRTCVRCTILLWEVRITPSFKLLLHQRSKIFSKVISKILVSNDCVCIFCSQILKYQQWMLLLLFKI